MQSKKHLYVMRDLIDQQVIDADGHNLSRVDDIQAEWHDGALTLTHLVIGPQALARRVAPWLYRLVRAILRDHFDHAIPLQAIRQIEPTEIHLKGDTKTFGCDTSEQWIATHLLRYIPGAGGNG